MPRNVLESLIIVLIALTFGMVLVLPQYESNLASKEKVEIKRVDLKNRENYFNELAKIAADFKNYSANVDKIKTALPVGPMAPSLANFIQSVSSQSGLILKNFTYGSNKASVAAGAVQEYEISLTLSGSYVAFKDFLNKIEKSSRLIEIGDINFVVSDISKKTSGLVLSPAVNNATNGAESGGEAKKTDDRIYEFNLKLKAHYY